MIKPNVLKAARACLVAASAAAALLVPAGALADADGAMAEGGEDLAMQPARVLAQQALATLRVLGDAEGAAVRLDAALESKDRSDIDFARLREATETLDGGDPEGAVPILDAALSKPLGSDSGKALHKSGREFAPEKGPAEVVGTVIGGVLLLLGAFGLRRARRTSPV